MSATIRTYAQAGVSRGLGDKVAQLVGGMARKTRDPRVRASIGGYASLYELSKSQWLAASTDGVGTKLKLAIDTGRHDTVGIDLVAMSVNDLLCVGARPLFFLDYFATGKLRPGVAKEVLSGVVEGCVRARCALVGGETAEMPDFYRAGDYDLGGFAVGSVAPARVLPRAERIRPGDLILGLASSGVHSNGYTWIRRLLAREKASDRKRWSLRFLEPTVIYADALGDLLEKDSGILGLAHVTGSGALNLPRMSDQVSYRVQYPTVKDRAEAFAWIEKKSGAAMSELVSTFNMGLGMAIVVKPEKATAVLTHLRRRGHAAFEAGEVIARRRGKGSEILFEAESALERKVISGALRY